MAEKTPGPLQSLFLIAGAAMAGALGGWLASLYMARRQAHQITDRLDYIDRKVGRHETDILTLHKYLLEGKHPAQGEE